MDKNFYNEKDFETFKNTEVPSELSHKIQNSMVEYVQPSFYQILTKYSLIFLIAAILSLFLCPQKGFGFLEKGYPLFFQFLHHNLILCGLYCGIFFGVVTHGVALLLLNHYERISIYRKYPWISAVWFGVAYFLFMLLGREYYSSDFMYSVVWIFSVLAIVLLLNKTFLQKSFK